jgi:50S ribosomal subunit-associated GTPase HflX
LKEQGLHLLNSALLQYFDQKRTRVSLRIPLEQAELRTLLYKQNAIVEETFCSDSVWEIEASLNKQLIEYFSAYIQNSSKENLNHPAA